MTPTEERELLELAAMAYGFKFHPDKSGGYLWNLDKSRSWSPLHYSGDCLELEARLKLDLMQLDYGVVAKSYDLGVEADEACTDESERLAATRLAVTRAAAEIGRRMKG